MLDFVYENQTQDKSWAESFFKNIFDKSISYLEGQKNLPAGRQVELGLQLITPERSRELNNQYRGKDKPTDVLSFPLHPHTKRPRSGSRSFGVGVDEPSVKEFYDILNLGDVFICLDVAKQQSDEMKIPLSQELARLAVHGLLHLLDYDHERSPEEEKKMTELQEKILEEILNPKS